MLDVENYPKFKVVRRLGDENPMTLPEGHTMSMGYVPCGLDDLRRAYLKQVYSKQRRVRFGQWFVNSFMPKGGEVYPELFYAEGNLPYRLIWERHI